MKQKNLVVAGSVPDKEYYRYVVKNSLNAFAFPSHGEVNTQPSLTVPDQSMSIQEILNRYARGLPLDGQRVPVYHGEDNIFPDPKYMDLVDRAEFAEAAQEEIDRIKKSRYGKKKKDVPSAPALPDGRTTDDDTK